MLTIQQRLAGLPPDVAPQIAVIARDLERGNAAAAERGIIAAMSRAPGHPEILRLFGLIQQRLGRNREALATLAQACALRPADAAIHNALAGVYEAVNDADRARAALRRACELAPDWASCWFNYGWRLYVDGDLDAAAPVLRHAVTLAPQDAQARTLLADALNAEGKPAEAQAHYRRVIAEHPHGGGTAWWGLAVLKPTPLDARDIEAMRAILRGSKVAAADRVTIGFALAIALEQQGDFGAAFAAMQTAHALARREETYDAAAASRHVDAILAEFPAPHAAPAQGAEIVFIVSLPRSGSTLTEQILAAHSQVSAGAELPDLAQVIAQESERMNVPYPQWARTHSQLQWQELGKRYLARTERWRKQRPRFTDKQPGNWRYVGAILAMLPDARVIVCRRDPLETCLACYRYMFRRHPYTHDFGDLASRWRDFDRAAARWKELYPDRVREQVYEKLVADPENQIRELLAFCGLPFEATCLEFHKTDRRVSTPSAAQVREPIRKDTARADKYGALLDPLRKELGLPPFVT